MVLYSYVLSTNEVAPEALIRSPLTPLLFLPLQPRESYDTAALTCRLPVGRGAAFGTLFLCAKADGRMLVHQLHRMFFDCLFR